MTRRLIDPVRFTGWTSDTVTRAVRALTIAPRAAADEPLARELLRWLCCAATDDPERLASHIDELRPSGADAIAWDEQRVSVAREPGSARMMRGTVKWFNETKGFGFIRRDEDGGDVFVHYSGISTGGFRTLCEGQAVSYEELQGPKGLYAVNVSPAT